MSSQAASAFSSLWFTYVLRAAAAYLLLWALCKFVRDPQFRFRLCAVVLTGMVAGWLQLLFLPGGLMPSGSHAGTLPLWADAHWPWTLSFVLTPRLATLASRARWAYLLILALLLLQFCARFWQLRTLLRSSRPVRAELQSLFESVRAEMQACHCELRLVPGLHSPATTGWWHPRILVPEGLSRLESRQLIDIFRHELMHVRRQDYLWDRLAAIGCCLVFFHPAAWLVRRQLRWERELVCDEGAVGRSTERRLEYAACLTHLANWRLSGAEFADLVDFLSSSSLLSTRVRTLVLSSKGEYSTSKRAALGLLAAATLSVAVWFVPAVAVVPSWSASVVPPAANPESSLRELPTRSQPVGSLPQPRSSRRRRVRAPDIIASDVYPRIPAPNQELSAGAVGLTSTSEGQVPLTPARGRMRWGLIPRVGGGAVRSVKFGVSKMGRHLSRRNHEQEAPAPLTTAVAEMPSAPL